jgi:hypothetical protein
MPGRGNDIEPMTYGVYSPFFERISRRGRDHIHGLLLLWGRYQVFMGRIGGFTSARRPEKVVLMADRAKCMPLSHLVGDRILVAKASYLTETSGQRWF